MRLKSRWLPIVMVLQASAGLAQAEMDLPLPEMPAQDAPAALAPPDAVTSAPDLTKDVAALRARFEDLKQRQAQDAALRQPASAQTLSRIESTAATITENEARQQLARWRVQTFEILAAGFQAAAPHALPAGVAPGTQPDIALAVIDAQATLYAQPVTDAQMVVRSLPERTTMLRIAESGPFTLVWSAGDGFTFVLSQFRQVY